MCYARFSILLYALDCSGMIFASDVSFSNNYLFVLEGILRLPSASRILGTGYDAGARIHSASWGGSSNAYGYLARSFDDFLYKNDEMLALVAAGNSGGGDTFASIGEPATAKNIISGKIVVSCFREAQYFS